MNLIFRKNKIEPKFENPHIQKILNESCLQKRQEFNLNQNSTRAPVIAQYSKNLDESCF
jgi:hypothetical protein